MGWSLWEVFVSKFRRSGEDDSGDSDSFVPSPLDLSSRYSHGGSDQEMERELAGIEEQANKLEEHQRIKDKS